MNCRGVQESVGVVSLVVVVWGGGVTHNDPQGIFSLISAEDEGGIVPQFVFICLLLKCRHNCHMRMSWRCLNATVLSIGDDILTFE